MDFKTHKAANHFFPKKSIPLLFSDEKNNCLKMIFELLSLLSKNGIFKENIIVTIFCDVCSEKKTEEHMNNFFRVNLIS